MGKKSFSRTEAEAHENLESISNDIPSTRMQSDQQVQNTDYALDTKPLSNGFALNKTKSKGSQIKQEAVAEVLAGGSDSGMGIVAGGRSVSGTGAGILGADNSTTIADKSRSKTRVGKKFDRIANKLNYTPNEQVLISFDESKPLADSANDDQGYNGTYRNEYARSQKHSGAVPGDLMFERSADLLLKDQLYFSQGQIVLPSSAQQTAYTPTTTYTKNGGSDTYKAKVGDFLTRKAHVRLNDQGEPVVYYFDVDDVTAYEADADLANKSAAFRKTIENQCELDRIAMDAKAGDEKADIWSPLPRAVNEPSKTTYLLNAIEAQTGAHAYLAYSKASTNLSYQLNRAAKDGMELVGPAVEELLGSIVELNSETDYLTNFSSVASTFDKDLYKDGAASLMIDAYDSKTKYNNKADVLLQPRGFRMHLQTADNNINALRVNEKFVQTFADQETFSTIGHDYDPLLPICMTDKAALIDALDPNDMSAYGVSHVNLVVTRTNIESNGCEDASILETAILVPATVNDGSGLYVYQKSSASSGIVELATDGAFGLKKVGTNSTDTIDIVINRSSTAPTGYTLVGSVAAGKDVTLRIPKIRDGGTNHDRISAVAITYDGDAKIYRTNGGPYKYAYSDLRNNYVVTVKHPLFEGICEYLRNSIGAKIYKLLDGVGELTIPWIFSTQYATLASYIICAATPWIQQVRQKAMKDVIYYEENIHEYPFSGLIAIKDAPFKNFVNFDYTGYDEPLVTKIMQPTTAIKWIMPEFFWHVDPTYCGYVCPWYFNQEEFEYDTANSAYTAVNQKAAMSMPSIRSGVRLASLDTLYSMSEKDIRLSLDRMTSRLLANSKIQSKGVYKYGKNTDGLVFIRFSAGSPYLTMGDIISCPRELGLVMDAPGKLLTPNLYTSISDTYDAITANGMLSSFRVKCWTSSSVTSASKNILSDLDVDIARGANYKQRWFQVHADALSSTNVNILGLIFGMNDEGAASYSPFIQLDDSTTVTNAPTVYSHQRSLWTRLQLMPFVISPFDAESSTGSTMIDLYEIPYVFGLAGFRASDYRESVYNRSKEVVNQGMLFVDDPWVLDSPILKHGASSTGISNTKGFELK